MENRQTASIVIHLILYNLIVLVISLLFMYILILRFDIRDFLFLLVPGTIFTSAGIVIEKRLKGSVSKGGMIGIVVWMFFTILLMVGLVLLLSRYGP